MIAPVASSPVSNFEVEGNTMDCEIVGFGDGCNRIELNQRMCFPHTMTPRVAAITASETRKETL